MNNKRFITKDCDLDSCVEAIASVFVNTAVIAGDDIPKTLAATKF
ncbi:hypothetical protein NSMS1_54590 [Nostoc sp. MS1]|nr:hypothetical protein NSMS1_54590 [Nostoc sp. MS1]